MSIELDVALEANMTIRENHLMHTAALEGSLILEANLGSTQGSGVHWPLLPHRSSAPGEYPVKQTGRLQAGVTFEADPSSPTGARVVIHDDLQKLIDLEFAPPSDNPNPVPFATRDTGGRAPMHMTFTDPTTIERMEDAMRRSP